MGKLDFKPGNMLYPLPAVMVSVRDKEGNDNIITVAWTGTVCTNPPMLYISVRPERHSYKALHETGDTTPTRILLRSTSTSRKHWVGYRKAHNLRILVGPSSRTRAYYTRSTC